MAARTRAAAGTRAATGTHAAGTRITTRTCGAGRARARTPALTRGASDPRRATGTAEHRASRSGVAGDMASRRAGVLTGPSGAPAVGLRSVHPRAMTPHHRTEENQEEQ